MPKHSYYPDVLIECDEITNEVAAGGRLVEVDLDPDAYSHGHIPGATCWDWEKQLRDQTSKEILSQSAFENLMEESGITPETPVLLYGDNNNWFACWAFWMMRLYGHKAVRLVDGGARKWIADQRELSLDMPLVTRTSYKAQSANLAIKATSDHVFQSFFNPKTNRLVDVRSGAEFLGRMTSPGIGKESTCEVAGHIPTAINIPWNLNCNVDGTFKSPEELKALYASFDILPQMTVITYCAIGERASLSWFVLKHLLGYEVVMNYDRSMAHWSSLSNAPLETGEAA